MKLMSRFLGLFILILGFSSISCHRDDLDIDIKEKEQKSPIIYQEVVSSIYGLVVDQDGNPIPHAKVEIYNTQTTTNESGVFVFKKTKMDVQGTLISVSKDGYNNASDFIYPQSNSTGYSYIQLRRNKVHFKISSTSGGIIELTDGVKITFPPNAFITEQNQPYNGIVFIDAYNYKPTDTNLGIVMPGGLIGIDNNESRVSIGAAALFFINAYSEFGNPLILNEEKRAVIDLPISGGNENLPLWRFDFNQGMWVQSSLASNNGNGYSGEIQQLGHYILGKPFELIDLSCRVVDAQGIPLSQIKVDITCTSNGLNLPVYSGYTDSKGFFNGKLPKGNSLHIKLSSITCPQKSILKETPALSQNTVLDDIVIDSNRKMITVRVLCNDNLVEGSAILLKKNEQYVILDVESGETVFNLYNYACELKDIEIVGIEMSTGKFSANEPFVESNVLYSLDVCKNGCNLSGNFIAQCDSLSIHVSGGSGQYTYMWSNGIAGNSISITSTEPHVYAVTVTDNLDQSCSKVFSKEVPGQIQAEIKVTDCKWPIVMRVEGKNFNKVEWTTGSQNKEVTVSPDHITEYAVTVSNSIGCSKEITVTIDPKNYPHIDNISYCQANFYNLSGNFDSGKLQGENGFYKNLTNKADLEGLNVFETGYKVYGDIYGGANCQKNFEIKLPNYDGLKITNMLNEEIIEGNKIEYNTGTGSCYNCDAGNVAIYSIFDLSVDYVNINKTGLPPGYYYVVVKDAITGCFIAHKKVKIL